MGCGEPPPPPPDPWQGDPAAHLDRVFAMVDPARKRALAQWPKDRGGFVDASATQIALTHRLADRLQAGQVEAAFDDFEHLRGHFDGGRRHDGSAAPLSVLRSALLDAALQAASDRVDGDRPDRDGAKQALQVAGRLTQDNDAPRLQRTQRWVESETLVALDAKGAARLAPHEGPRVVAFLDAFELGEAKVASTLERWANHKTVRVSLVAIRSDHVRVGIRRVPASRADARRAVAQSAEAIGATFEATASKRRWARILGLGHGACAVLVLAADGRIVARLRGRGLGLQRVEGAVQRVATR